LLHEQLENGHLVIVGLFGGGRFLKMGKMVNLSSFSHREHRGKFSQACVLDKFGSQSKLYHRTLSSSTGAEQSARLLELTERVLLNVKKEGAEFV